MARIRRVTVATYKVATRHTETPTRQKSKRALEEMRDGILTRAFAEEGITLTPEDIQARGFRLSPAREVYDGHDVIAYAYDITVRV